MHTPSELRFPQANALNEARKWLLIGAFALALSGLYSIPLFIGRTPMVKDSPYFQHLFDTTLVVHVDLSIFVWFLAIIAMCWQLFAATEQRRWLRLPYFEIAARWLFAGGTILMAASPWFGGDSIKSNYIPVIGNGVFFLSLALIATALTISLIEMLLARNPFALLLRIFSPEGTIADTLAFGAYGAAIITFIALLCFWLTGERIDHNLTGQSYYEMVFWAGGHVMQFAYVQVLMIAWLMLAAVSGLSVTKPNWLYAILFLFGIIASFDALTPFSRYAVESADFRDYYTQMMIRRNGVAPMILAVLIAIAAFRSHHPLPWKRATFLCLLVSFGLFLFGGLFAMFIHGENVRVPAHYHGSIVGVTVAFMGLAYALLPRFGYVDPASWKLARWQPLVLGLGQLMHTSALAYAGGYDVLRKTVGGLQDFPVQVKIAMGFVGGGGAIAIAGGLMFVLVVWRTVKHEKTILDIPQTTR